MDDCIFRVEVDVVLRKVLSKNLGLLTYERGPDFRTEDFENFIEMKSRRIKCDDEKNHFSVKPRQYESFKESIQQTFWHLENGNLTSVRPELVYLLLKYKTDIPISRMPPYMYEPDSRREVIEKNLDLSPGSYLIDHNALERFATRGKKWISVKTASLDKEIIEKGLEPLKTRKLSIPMIPIGKHSKELAEKWS
jgi:hypothetical protein